MLDRQEAIVLVGIIDSYKEQLESIMTEEDFDLITSFGKQLQNRLQIKENLTF